MSTWTFRLIGDEWVRVETELEVPVLVIDPMEELDEQDLCDRVAPYLMQCGAMFLLAAPGISNKVIRALRPLTDFMAAIAYPICYLGIGCGMILVMLGQKHRGMQLIKNAAIGYVGMQFLPAIMSILVEIAQAMMSG